ncbi:MAG TPA: hypothetical protein VGJ13_19400 [Pseudonocardiaceae bacterium]
MSISHAESAKLAGCCAWCGARLPTGRAGRPRRYCAQACRQRAYEQRSAVQRAGLADDAVVLSEREFADLTDRIFQLRCAAEDVLTAVTDGAGTPELHRLASDLAMAARALERLR